MTPRASPRYLRRYTDLPALLHLLHTRQLTLLNPDTWDDKNDAFFMSEYKRKCQLKTVLALCFTQATETYHHWRVFSPGPAGVCLEFDGPGLLQDLDLLGVRCEPVAYLRIKDCRDRRLGVREMPFVKRLGYEPEKEFRAVYASSSKELSNLGVDLSLTSIRSISLSPWMHRSLSEATVKAIRAIDGCARLKVSRSTLISNEQWKRWGAAAT